MRLSTVLFLLLLAPAVNGCASLSSPHLAAVLPETATPPASPEPQSAAAWAADLDTMAYGEPAPIVVQPAPVASNPFLALTHLFARRGAGPMMPAPIVIAAPAMEAPPVIAVAMPAVEEEGPYTVDTGDRLRIVVFGQEGLSNSYVVDAQGNLSLPLIGTVAARAHSTAGLARIIADQLRRGFIREPHVSIEVESYRPFFILGEVVAPGQYPYVPRMTVENAVAIAGGYTPRAYRWELTLDRPTANGTVRKTALPLARVQPGDTIVIKERWF